MESSWNKQDNQSKEQTVYSVDLHSSLKCKEDQRIFIPLVSISLLPLSPYYFGGGHIEA